MNEIIKYIISYTKYNQRWVKPQLIYNIVKNFRPISNLPFLSKVIERIAVDK